MGTGLRRCDRRLAQFLPGAGGAVRFLPHGRAAQSPEGDAAADVEQDRQQKGEPIAAREIEDPPRAPGAGG